MGRPDCPTVSHFAHSDAQLLGGHSELPLVDGEGCTQNVLQQTVAAQHTFSQTSLHLSWKQRPNVKTQNYIVSNMGKHVYTYK